MGVMLDALLQKYATNISYSQCLPSGLIRSYSVFPVRLYVFCTFSKVIFLINLAANSTS